MPLNVHQTFHLDAVIVDAQGMVRGAERNRRLREANEFLSGGIDWVDIRMFAHEIHVWVEEVDSREKMAEQFQERALGISDG